MNTYPFICQKHEELNTPEHPCRGCVVDTAIALPPEMLRDTVKRGLWSMVGAKGVMAVLAVVATALVLVYW